MGATANEDRQAISKHVDRNDLSFMRVAPGAESVTIPRYTLTLINYTDKGQVMGSIKMDDKALLEKIEKDISELWHVVYIVDNYAMLPEQAI